MYPNKHISDITQGIVCVGFYGVGERISSVSQSETKYERAIAWNVTGFTASRCYYLTDFRLSRESQPVCRNSFEQNRSYLPLYQIRDKSRPHFRPSKKKKSNDESRFYCVYNIGSCWDDGTHPTFVDPSPLP